MAAKKKTGGTTGRKRYHATNRSSRSIGEEAIEGFMGFVAGAVLKSAYYTATGRGRSLWKSQIDRMKYNAKTVKTGRRYDSRGNLNENDGNPSGPRAFFNRATSVVAIPFNVMGAGISAPITLTSKAAQKTVKTAGMAVGTAALMSARPLGRLAGGAIYETSRVTGQVLNGGVKGLRIHGFMDAAMAATFLGATGVGLGLAINEIGGGNRAFSGNASGLTGTTGHAPTPLVNTGANGDLVLAMHKLR